LDFFLLLVLQLLEGASAVTPLPTNSAKIGEAGKNENKWAVTYLGTSSKVFFSLSFSLSLSISLSFGHRRGLEDS
jgi:hypothetical protein